MSCPNEFSKMKVISSILVPEVHEKQIMGIILGVPSKRKKIVRDRDDLKLILREYF